MRFLDWERSKRVTRVVGLTGGIGTGKSTVSRLLADLGAVVIDADAIVHELQAPSSPVLAEIANALGGDVLDATGALDRARVAERVFQDPAQRQRLNAIMHPRVGAEMARRSDAARRAGAPLIVMDIPLLFETRPRDRAAARGGADATVLVYAPRSVQIERTVARDGCTREQAEHRIAAQLPIDEKRALADHVIDNSGALADTDRQVRALFATLCGGAAPRKDR
ncbi:MAG: dephospho-CoA kinase [Proteobacteria bacterium]|nr:dephospho-CoA kinase [Pseudomonadota bacterium]